MSTCSVRDTQRTIPGQREGGLPEACILTPGLSKHPKAIGLTISAVGIWLVVEGNSLSVITGNSYVSGAAVIIAAGVVTALICVLGIVAAIGKFRPLLAIVSFYIYCIYISASIYVWFFFFSSCLAYSLPFVWL